MSAARTDWKRLPLKGKPESGAEYAVKFCGAVDCSDIGSLFSKQEFFEKAAYSFCGIGQMIAVTVHSAHKNPLNSQLAKQIHQSAAGKNGEHNGNGIGDDRQGILIIRHMEQIFPQQGPDQSVIVNQINAEGGGGNPVDPFSAANPPIGKGLKKKDTKAMYAKITSKYPKTEMIDSMRLCGEIIPA